MAEYFIGMHIRYDNLKYQRDFRDYINGFEVCMFTEEIEIEKLLECLKINNYKIGIHFPFRKQSYKLRDPLLLSQDINERIEAFLAVEKEIVSASQINAEYLLLHFPKPFVISEELNRSKCKFDENELIWSEGYPFSEFKTNCENVFIKLSELSKRHKVQVILELELMNDYLYKGDLLQTLLVKYPNIGVCIDTARIHVLEKLDPHFDVENFLISVAPYTQLLHISNICVNETIEKSHYPAMPNLKEEDGWADIGRYLDTLSLRNSNVKVLFEHRSDLISDEELETCYNWILGYFQ